MYLESSPAAMRSNANEAYMFIRSAMNRSVFLWNSIRNALWKSCDELRGGMDASQYKDYVLTLLFMKYVSDKYTGDDEFADITVPPGETSPTWSR